MRELLLRLARAGAKLEVRDGRLRVNAPEGALTPELRDAIREHRDELVAVLGTGGAKAAEEEERLGRIVPDPESRHRPFPLNDVQHAYFIGRDFGVELGNVATHFYFELRCRNLDLDRLDAALRRVIAHHDMLRSIVTRDGRQKILPAVPDYEIARHDLRGDSGDERERRLAAIRAEMSQQVLPHDRWPLFDIRAARLPDGETRLYFSWDCLVIDAWSLSILFRQWHALYTDPGYALPDLELSFRDYLLAELELKEGKAYRRARESWWRRLDSLPPAPILPVERKIDPRKKYSFARRRSRLPAETWGALKSRAQSAGLTPSSLLLAAFCEVVTRWSKDPHYCLNLTLFNRLPLHEQVHDLVGDFTSLLVLEVEAERGATFRERALALQRRFLKDLEHREVNGVEVLRELAKRRGLQGKAILPVVFTSTLMVGASQDQDMGVLQKFGEMEEGLSQTPQVLLDYQLFEFGGELVFNWDTVDELFRLGVLDAMFACQCELLRRLAERPESWDEKVVARLPEAQRRVLAAANETAAEVSGDLLHTPFLRRALEDPERVALEGPAGSLTYGELLAHGQRIAGELLAAGVAPGELVAVVMEKGWEQVAAVLGILLAGGAYLPIDPSLPRRRRDELLEQGAARIALTQPRLLAELEWPAGPRPMAVERLQRPEIPTAAPAPRQGGADLAYVIFTSGSTGTPKGVMIDHRAAVNTVFHVNRLFDVGPRDKVLAVSSLSFDLSVYDLFGLLAAGGSVVLPEAGRAKEPAHWHELMSRHGVTIWNSAPPLMELLVEHLEARPGASLRPLRLALLSGDWIATTLPDRVRALAEEPRVISLGGATEGSIWSIHYPVPPGVPASWERIPYGKPLPNQHMYVLDKNLARRPIWVVGDIYIGGLGVARGYWRDEEKTAERFLTHPETGERLYWTGDLGRYFPDGDIEFLGREDQQVKLHGHRVELGEITAHLRAHPGVADGVVRVVEDDGRSVLTAWVVPGEDAAELFDSEEIPAQRAEAVWEASRARGRRSLAEYCRVHEDELTSFDEFWRRAERLAKLGMADTLRRLGVFSAEGGTDLGGILRAAGVKPRHEPLARQWLKVLRADGLVGAEGSRLVAGEGASAEAFAAASESLAEWVARRPRFRQFHRYLDACLERQLELLRDEVTPLEILFPGGSWELAEALYETNPAAAALSRALAEMVAAAIASREGDRAVRVLEVGAGTGGGTAAVLPLLPAERAEYWFTDLSNFFLAGAKEKFKDHPFVKYGTYDINRPAAEQGYAAHGFDFVLGDNVLHNARDVKLALSRLRDLLKPGGHLLLLEGTENTPWQMVTVAYLEGFGEHEAGTVRDADLPLLAAEEWRELLGEAGYEAVATFPQSPPPADSEAGPGEACLRRAMPQHVIAARAPRVARRFSGAALAEHLRARLPDYMVPAEFIPLDALPLSANGKVDLKALPRPRRAGQARERKIALPKTETEQAILAIWKEVLGVDPIGVDESFFEVGGDSLLMTRVLGKINAALGRALTSADLFTYPTVRSLTRYLSGAGESPEVAVAAPAAGPRSRGEGARGVAIVGLAGRFPDAPDVERFWRNLEAGRCSVRHYRDEELLDAGVDAEILKREDYVKAGVPLADVELFDAGYFGISPREAEVMDPQLRFLLECAVEALEHAGHIDERYSGRIGVFVGKDTSRYFLHHLLGRPEILETLGMLAITNVNEKDYAATQLSYRLDLTGPSLNVNTACSSSLVAVHEACRSLLAGECEVALAGGVSIDPTQPGGYFFKKGYIASPDGYCRAFSADAAGTIGGSGVALVVLRPLAAALAGGDTIHAVIKGSAINNDGSLKVAYSAPSVTGQARVIADALAAAAVDPATIGYVEAHGTGTHLGDPVEIAALNRVYGGGGRPRASCAIGSVKTNIGHLDAAAGATSLIKTVEALKRRRIPPSLHFSAPNPAIDFDGGPFFVNTEARAWEPAGAPLRAGVSSFGVGGTNAHVVLEEAPPAPRQAAERGARLLVLSAKRADSVRRMAADLAAHWTEHPELALPDVAFTLQMGRKAHGRRAFLVCEDAGEAVARLARPESLFVFERDESRTPSVAFLFPGQGTGNLEATWDLYRQGTEFRASLDRCAEILATFLGTDIRALLYPDWRPDGPPVDAETAMAEEADPRQTALVQPLLFAVEYALAKWWMSLGVEPEAMIGHSLGEYVAACLAGVFTLEEALSLVVVRGQLMQTAEAGRMLAVGLAEAELAPRLAGTECDLAAVNGPGQCVISGPEEALSAIREKLEADGIRVRALETTRAFHSRMMDPILDVYEECLGQVELHPPKIPFLSNVTGRWITGEEATSPAYWARHLRRTVRFSDGVRELLGGEGRTLLEVGPTDALSSLVKTHGPARHRVVASFANPRRETAPRRALWRAVGELWGRGVEIRWPALWGLPGLPAAARPRRVPLPAYRFDRGRYWVPRAPRGAVGAQAHGGILAMEAETPRDDPRETSAASRGEEPRLYPRPFLETPYAAPEREIETRLAEIWRRFLGIETPGIDDNFFELGGDSLMATQVAVHIDREFDTEVPIEKMFELVTIRQLADYISLFSGELDVDSLSEEELDSLLKVAES